MVLIAIENPKYKLWKVFTISNSAQLVDMLHVNNFEFETKNRMKEFDELNGL